MKNMVTLFIATMLAFGMSQCRKKTETIESVGCGKVVHITLRVGGSKHIVYSTTGTTTSFTVNISDQTSVLPVLSYGRSDIKFVPSVVTCKQVFVFGMKNVATVDFETLGIGGMRFSVPVMLMFCITDSVSTVSRCGWFIKSFAFFIIFPKIFIF